MLGFEISQASEKQKKLVQMIQHALPAMVRWCLGQKESQDQGKRHKSHLSEMVEGTLIDTINVSGQWNITGKISAWVERSNIHFYLSVF